MRNALLSALLVSVVGCGPPSGNSDGSTDDMAVPGDDLATGNAPADLASPPNTGTINVTSFQSTAQSLYSAGASFVAGVIPSSSPQCTLSVVGSCQAYACIVQSLDAGSGGTAPPLVSAGTVTISGGTTTATMTPGAGNIYSASSNTQSLFAGGETLTFATSGAAAPASSTMLVAPTAVTITTPAQAASYTITRANGFALAWSGGGPGSFDFTIQSSISSTAPGTHYGSVRCQFPVAGGSATVPAAALAVLPTGGASFQVGVSNSASSAVGDWVMNANAVTYALAPGGAPFVGGQATVN
ncbi:MAG: hypothetical protein JWM53_3211 [bacterium]|nr:hypothetical protein [bacterium]